MQALINIPKNWQKPLVLIVVSTLLLLAAFWETWDSMASIWSRSDTFAHGYLVAPVSLWLLWTHRQIYRPLNPAPSPWGALGLLGCGFLWLAADLSQVLVVEQFALIGLLISLSWSILGTHVVLKMLFPLGFLFLMVPFGEDFVPFLMEYTASFVVMMLRLTGISVYREGLHFTLTSGNWSVIEACSGIRYLLASFTLGLIYAYLNYVNLWKRSLFILFSILVPILANGLRAYMVVMIGHLSNMKLATGVDHIIYGWLFFGLVMLLLFYLGSFWRDEAHTATPMAGDATAEAALSTRPPQSIAATSAWVLACLLIWPWLAYELHARQAIPAVIPTALLQNLPPPAEHAAAWSWQPEFAGAQAEARRFVTLEDTDVGFYLANFGDEAQGRELINSQNLLITKSHKNWRIIHAAPYNIPWPGGAVAVEEFVLNSPQHDLLALRWYRIGNTNTANAYYAKWLQLLKRLSGDASPELMVVVYTQTPSNDYVKARQRLQTIALACCS